MHVCLRFSWLATSSPALHLDGSRLFAVKKRKYKSHVEMAPGDKKSGIKRRADSADHSSNTSIKRAKPNSIMDYMKPKDQKRTAKLQNTTTGGETSTHYAMKNQDGDVPDDEDELPQDQIASKAPYGDCSNTNTTNHSNKLRLTESVGDIFNAPPNSLIIHACNCEGSWGAGIAAAFKQHYMGAFKVYAAHCKQNGHDLFGNALFISPQKLDKKKQHFVGCLFTSRSKGKKKDSPSAILEATKPAMEDLLQQVKEWNSSHAKEEAVGEVRICKINSGLFAVPWNETKELMESIDVDQHDIKEVKVISREE